MIVKGKLTPILGHFQKMVALQKTADDARVSGGCPQKIVGQHQLPPGVPVGAHQVLHNLDKHAAGIVPERIRAGIQHFVAQGLQGAQAVAELAVFQGGEQVDDRVGHA